MITILHGEHQVDSRSRLLGIKSQKKKDGYEIIDLDGSVIDITDLIQSFESQSLFSKYRLVTVENLIGSLRPGAKRDAIIFYLIQGGFDAEVVLWEKKAVGRQIIKLKKAKHVQVEEFKMPTAIFKFVDNLYPGNAKLLLTYVKDTISNNVVPEIIFTMIVRQFRIMLAFSTNAPISEVTRLAPWQKGNFIKQAQRFSVHHLTKQYKELLIIDYQTKSGQSAFDLTKRIEQFIIGL